ncbi:3-phosphoinositide-dependent protein kinase B [Eurosta solidaginis]|uniref:3-phosphoinositide-dependent protein kinase B n=1 Tax=Eurosta solidaginis TaxID=178769 RepID=UPI003530E420
MVQSNILHFLALASILFVFTDAHYPYSQQHYYINHQQGAQSYYPNGNYQRYNSINNNNNNNNNNIAYSHFSSNSNNYNDVNNGNNVKNINEFIKNNRRHGHNNNSLLGINLPKIYLGDFEYVPTPNGYRFSYDRSDGTRHTEVGIIPDSENTAIYKQDESPERIAERMALRMRGRENSKNRKLSPKALQSLAG